MQCRVNFLKQRVAEQRFLHESGPSGRGAFPNGSAWMRGNEDRRRHNLAAPQLRQEIQSVHSRQLVVDDQATGLGGRTIF